jgi:hypothetical protein
LTEEKQTNQLAQTEYRFIKNKNYNEGGRQLLDVLRLQISVVLQQKTGNFKVAIVRRVMQRSALTEEKQKNELEQTKFRFIQITIIRRAGAIASQSLPPNQRCTGAKDG